MIASQERTRILSKVSAERDTLKDSPDVSLKWNKSENGLFSYTHDRPLTHEDAQRAIDYIEAIVKQYPFQIRYAMAIPLWKRFADEWCDTGDLQKSLGVI